MGSGFDVAVLPDCEGMLYRKGDLRGKIEKLQCP